MVAPHYPLPLWAPMSGAEVADLNSAQDLLVQARNTDSTTVRIGLLKLVVELITPHTK